MSTRTRPARRPRAARVAADNGTALRQTPAPHDLVDVLRLQLHLNRLNDEVLGRYLSEPNNVDEIAGILDAAYSELTALRIQGQMSSCPRGTSHVNCRCQLDSPPEKNPPVEIAVRRRAR